MYDTIGYKVFVFSGIEVYIDDEAFSTVNYIISIYYRSNGRVMILKLIAKCYYVIYNIIMRLLRFNIY